MKYLLWALFFVLENFSLASTLEQYPALLKELATKKDIRASEKLTTETLNTLDPKAALSTKGMLFENLATIYIGSKEWKKAEDFLVKAIAYYEADKENSLIQLGSSYFKLMAVNGENHLQKSIDYFEAAGLYGKVIFDVISDLRLWNPLTSKPNQLSSMGGVFYKISYIRNWMQKGPKKDCYYQDILLGPDPKKVSRVQNLAPARLCKRNCLCEKTKQELFGSSLSLSPKK